MKNSKLRRKLIVACVNAKVFLGKPRLMLTFRIRLGRWPNVAAPRDYHEKMLWSKVFEKNPFYVRLSDKILAKEYIKENFPDVACAKVQWSGVNMEDVPDHLLRERGLLKTNHGSSQIVKLPISPDKEAKTRKRVKRWLSRPYGQRKGEWAYRNIHRRLFIEEELSCTNKTDLLDFKFYTSGERVILVWVARRDSNFKCQQEWFLNRDGLGIPLYSTAGFPKGVLLPQEVFQQMIKLVERMAQGIENVRIDFMRVGGTFYFSEYTFYSQGGFDFDTVDSPLVDDLGRKWRLNRTWYVQQLHGGLSKAYAEILKTAEQN